MPMDQIVQMLVNNGTAVAVIAYFMYRDYKFMDTLQSTLTTLVDTVNVLKDTLNNTAQIQLAKKGE